MSKIVFITGGHGFIGRHVARYFSSLDWEVIGIGHGKWKHDCFTKWGFIEWHSSDVTLESLGSIGKIPDAIIHCAGSGSVGFSIENPKQDFDRNVSTTLSVLEFVRLYAPSIKIVNLSSAGVYGAVQHIPIAEDTPLYPVSPYGIHKKIAEELCCSYAKHFDLAVVVLRLFSVYGIGLPKQLLWDACNKLKNNDFEFFGTGDEVRDWIHVEDVASLAALSLDHASSSCCRIVNGGCGERVSVNEVLSWLFHCTGKKEVPFFSGTDRPGDPSHYVADISKVFEWGWHPKIDWKDGVREYVDWFHKVYGI